jgi:hypothetical protein
MFMQKIERAFGFYMQTGETRPPRVDRSPPKPEVPDFSRQGILYATLGFMQSGLQKIQEEPGYQRWRMYSYTEKVSF